MTVEATMAATAVAAVAAVAPYLVEAGKEGAKTLGKEAAAGAVRLLGWLHATLTPTGQEALAKLEKTPANVDRQVALRVAISDLLAENATRRDELAKLLDGLPQMRADQTLTQNGDHNRAAQVAGQGNTTTIN